MAEIPAFDPSKPFDADTAPAFDPTKPFDAAPAFDPTKPFEPAPARKEAERPTTAPTQQLATDFLNQGSAAGQRTTPNIAAHTKNLISADTFESDTGDVLYKHPQSGEILPTDKNKHVVLRDPSDNRVKVFGRTDDTDEGVLSSLGRVAMTGMAAGAPTPRPGIASATTAAPLTKWQEIAGASQRLDVPISRAAATESIPLQATAGALKELPFIGTPLVKSSKKSIEAMDRAAGKTVAGYGSGEPLIAGQEAAKGLEQWITGTSRDVASRLYKRVDALVDPAHTRELDATRNVVGDIMAERANSKIKGTSHAVDEVMDAVQTPGGLNYKGLKGLRTYIYEMTPAEMIAKGIKKVEAKRIYGALTEDLRATVLQSGGPDAVAAFNRANRVYEGIADKRAALAKVIGVEADAAPEKVMGRIMAMAGSKQAADYQKLTQVRRAIGPEKWDEVTSAVVNTMGRDKPGAEFSGARFKTSWDALPDNSKRLLFNSTGKPDLAKSVEDLMTLSDAHKQLMKYGNPSGTGRTQSVFAMIGAGGSFYAAPLTTLATGMGSYMFARFLAAPAAVKQAKTWTTAYTNAAQNPTPQRMSMLISQSDMLAKAINRDLGGNISGSDFLRSIQGVGVGRTEENKDEVPRVPGKQHDDNKIGQQHGGAVLGQGTSRETAFDIEKLTPKQRLLLPDGAFYRWKDPGNPSADKDGYIYRQRDHAKTAPTMPR